MEEDDLGELFERDPLKLTDQDIHRIIIRLRQNQSQHELGVKPKAAPPKKSTKTQDLLKDLGLG
jgi:hypothetical protein